MEPYIASIDPEQVQQAANWGIRDIITNPTVISHSGTSWKRNIRKSLESIDGQIHIQTTPDDPVSILAQVAEFSALSTGRLVVKLPFTRSALRVLPQLRKAQLPVNLTGIVTLPQGLMALTAGAQYISVYVGRANKAGGDGLGIIRSLRESVRNSEGKTKVLAASIHTSEDFASVAMAGAHAAACPFDLLVDVMDNEVTDKSMTAFQQDWLRTQG